MNLQENILRIKEVMGLLFEEKEVFKTNTFELSNEYNPEVEKLQKFLVSQGFNLGNYGPSKDGVDGIFGPLTKKAFQEYQVGEEPSTIENDLPSTKILFVGGLEKNMGLEGQTNLLRQGTGVHTIKSFHYFDSDSEINEYIDENPGVRIFLFSAGTNKITPISQNENTNLKNVFIIEPYSASRKVVSKIESAISKGLPRKNIFHGGTSGRGSSIKGATSSGASNHFGALKTVPSLI